MSQSTRIWCPVPARFIPAWISLAAASGPRDPLEEAVASLCRVGRGRSVEIARTLCLDEGLIRSALDELLRKKLVHEAEGDAGRYVLQQDADARERPEERAGWVVWNETERRPLLHIILGRRLDQPVMPEGVEVLDLGERPGWPGGHRPGPEELERELRILPGLGGLSALESCAGHYRPLLDASLVRRVRRDPRHRERHGVVYVPLEFRPDSPPIVWRPSVLPSREIHTSLDPNGFDGLLSRLPQAARERLLRRRLEARGDLDALLQAGGFKDAADLFDHASRRVQRTLAGSWGNPGWERLQDLSVQAQCTALVSRMTNQDWRSAVHGWSDVLEHLMYELLRSVVRRPESFDAIDRLGMGKEGVERRRARLQAKRGVLRTSSQHAEASIGTATRKLADLLERGTIGQRLMLLAIVYACDDEAERRLRPALQECPDLFARMSAALDNRNASTHTGDTDGRETISVKEYTDNVLELTRAVMRVAPPIPARGRAQP